MKIILETKRLILREYEMSDFDALSNIICDAETMKYYPHPYDSYGVIRWLSWSFDNYKKYGFGLWAIILKDTNEFIGDCGLTLQNIDGVLLPEIGYHINKQYWRNGYAKEAGLAVRDYIFQTTKYEELYSYMNALNIPSTNTALSLGMKIIKQYEDNVDGLTTVCSITREKWNTMRKI